MKIFPIMYADKQKEIKLYPYQKLTKQIAKTYFIICWAEAFNKVYSEASKK